jgi:hypothetical protein
MISHNQPREYLFRDVESQLKPFYKPTITCIFRRPLPYGSTLDGLEAGAYNFDEHRNAMFISLYYMKLVCLECAGKKNSVKRR